MLHEKNPTTKRDAINCGKTVKSRNEKQDYVETC